jgi:hypothetical protein
LEPSKKIAITNHPRAISNFVAKINISCIDSLVFKSRALKGHTFIGSYAAFENSV